MVRAVLPWMAYTGPLFAAGWWGGGRPILPPSADPQVNVTQNNTGMSWQGVPPLSFFSFGKKPQGVPPSPPSPPPVSGSPNGASPPSADGDLSWGWWSVSLLVEWAVGRVFSTRSHPGSASTRGGWAGYVIDRSGLWMFGNFWPAVGALVGLAWALRTLRQVCCCCCRRGEHPPVEGGAPPGAVPAPRVAADLPSLAVAKGFVSLELTGPDAPRAVDTEYYQRKIRGRGVGRKPHDVVVKLDQGAWDGGSRIDRTGLLVHYSRVLGVTDRRLREELEREGNIHLCRQRECSHPALLHCRCYAAVDSEALVDLGAYGRFSAWRASVLLARLSRTILGGLLFFARWVWRGNIALRRPSRAGAGPRQIQERGVLRSLDPESESEAEVLEDPCQAVQVGLELQGVVKALAVEDCTDRAAAEPTRLLERDSELSDLGGSRTARLCNHHSQLYMMSCQGRKCSVLSCYGAVHGAHRGALTPLEQRVAVFVGEPVLLRLRPSLGSGSVPHWYLFPGTIMGVSPDSRRNERLLVDAPSLQLQFSIPAMGGDVSGVGVYASRLPPHLKEWAEAWDGVAVQARGSPPVSLTKEHRARLASDPEASFIPHEEGRVFLL